MILVAIATALGILCLVYPSLSLWLICVITGLGMIAYGIVETVASMHVRKLQKASTLREGPSQVRS